VPAYLLSGWLLVKDLAAIPEKRELKMRRWLIYFTLFIAAITIVVDLIIFVYNFLNGDLTIQFFLKVLTVLMIAGAVFGYYLWELKRQNFKSKIPKILAVAVAIVTLGSIIWGFFIVGTPASQRDRRFDERRINDLQILQDQIISYWSKKEILPENLQSLEDSIIGFNLPTDPKTGQSYEYRASGPLVFELCAVFSLTSEQAGLADKGMATPYNPYQQNWEHQAGRQCWERNIDPAFYKIDKTDSIEIN
jgi:amino acid transporter